MTFWQKVRLWFELQSLMKRLGIPWKERRWAMRKMLQWAGWANVGMVAFQAYNNTVAAFPALQTNTYVMVANAILAALLPSLNLPVVGSIPHKLAGTKVIPKGE